MEGGAGAKIAPCAGAVSATILVFDMSFSRTALFLSVLAAMMRVPATANLRAVIKTQPGPQAAQTTTAATQQAAPPTGAGAAPAVARRASRRAAEMPPEAARGAQQFQQTCSFCHGADATGARGPDLLRSQLVRDDATGAAVAAVVHSGRPDKGMPAFPQLNESQVADIFAFLRYRIEHLSTEPGGSYPLERLLVGNAEAGRAFFEGAGGCTHCHSATGDLAGIASRLAPLNLQQNMLMPRSREPRTVALTLHDGQELKGRLANLDDFTVALVDASGWYRSFPRTEIKSIAVTDPLEAHRRLVETIRSADMHNLFAYLETLK
jgi:cytochrome c oxidase cbb3-type subunit 3